MTKALISFKNHEIRVSEKDKQTVRELLSGANAQLAHHDKGFRVEKDGKVMHLGAAICDHLADEFVRPRNGDWFDVRRINLNTIKADSEAIYYR